MKKTPCNYNGIGFFWEDVRATRIKFKKRTFNKPADFREEYRLQISFAGGGWITLEKEKVSLHPSAGFDASELIRNRQNQFEKDWTNFKNKQQ